MTDPVTFEIVKHRLWQINDEQGIAIKTISASPIVVEGNDYNVGLFTDSAELVTAGVGSLVHVTTMGDALASIISGADSINDGDVFMTNDPFLGALHQNDVVVASPVFRDGKVFMWIGNVLHHPDVGGIDAGSLGNIEGAEWKFPIRYLYRRRMTDSAGAGRFRGGATSEVAFTPHGVESIELKLTNTAGTEQTNAHGINGGYPGAGSQSALVRDADLSVLRGNAAAAPDMMNMGGELSWLPSKADEIIHKGDVYGFWAAGGGGFGDPLDRTPAEITRDLQTGTVSRDEAERLYGVVVGEDGVVDDPATTARRRSIRRTRKQMAEQGDIVQIGPCKVCGATDGHGRIRRPLSHAGPLIALRYDGDGPNFEIEETICRSCGALADVREVLKSDRFAGRSGK